MVHALDASWYLRLEEILSSTGAEKITSFTRLPRSRYSYSVPTRLLATTARSTQALARLSLLLGSFRRSPSPPYLINRISMSSSSASTTQQPYAREQEIAIAAVLKASLLAQKIQQELVGSGGVQKKDKSPVTGQSLLSSLPGFSAGGSWWSVHRRRRGILPYWAMGQ